MTMISSPVGVERRIGQRFPFNLPVSLRDVSTAVEGLGFTQDVSSRGVFFFTVMALNEGTEIELTLKMPSEITLGESMRVRCRGHVLRIVNAADNGWKPAPATHTEIKLPDAGSIESKLAEIKNAEVRGVPVSGQVEVGRKIGVAVCLKGYEYLPETEDASSEFRRISALHSASEAERSTPPAPASPRVAAQ
jgi:PilZ domain